MKKSQPSAASTLPGVLGVPEGLAALPPSLRALAECGVERRYRKGTLFIQEGEPGGPLYFVMRGRVRAFTARDDGQEFTFGYYGPGSYLGELSLDGGPRSASVIAEEPVLCRIVTPRTLPECIARDPQLAIVLMTHLIQRVRDLSARVTNLALDDARSRLVQLLRRSGVAQPDGSWLQPARITQEQMASQIGCSRTMVTRLLGELVKEGCVLLEHKRWRLLRLPKPQR